MPSGKFGKFLELRWRDRRDLLIAMIGLRVLAIALKTWGLSRVQARLKRRRPTRRPLASDEVDRLVRIVDVAARSRVSRANCLQRCLMLWWLLRRRGVASDIRIGVGTSDGGEPIFHAWIEREGRVVNDRADIANDFLPFDRSVAPSMASFD